MKTYKYKIDELALMSYGAEIRVEAETKEEADKLAYEEMKAGNYTWDDCGDNQGADRITLYDDSYSVVGGFVSDIDKHDYYFGEEP